MSLKKIKDTLRGKRKKRKTASDFGDKTPKDYADEKKKARKHSKKALKRKLEGIDDRKKMSIQRDRATISKKQPWEGISASKKKKKTKSKPKKVKVKKKPKSKKSSDGKEKEVDKALDKAIGDFNKFVYSKRFKRDAKYIVPQYIPTTRTEVKSPMPKTKSIRERIKKTEQEYKQLKAKKKKAFDDWGKLHPDDFSDKPTDEKKGKTKPKKKKKKKGKSKVKSVTKDDVKDFKDSISARRASMICYQMLGGTKKRNNKLFKKSVNELRKYLGKEIVTSDTSVAEGHQKFLNIYDDIDRKIQSLKTSENYDILRLRAAGFKEKSKNFYVAKKLTDADRKRYNFRHAESLDIEPVMERHGWSKKKLYEEFKKNAISEDIIYVVYDYKGKTYFNDVDEF